MGDQFQIENLKEENERLKLMLKNLEHEIRNTYVYSCESIWDCKPCMEKDGVRRSLEAEYEFGENLKKISRWMQCAHCGWNDKLPGIVKRYVYKSKFTSVKNK